MKTRRLLFSAIMAGLLVAGGAMREACAIDFCPTISLVLTNMSVTGSQVTVCAGYSEIPGSYRGQSFTFPYKRWSWVVEDIAAEPQEGLGSCAVYSNANGDVGNITFTLTCRTRLWPHCNSSPGISKKIIVDIEGDGGEGLRKGEVSVCSDETHASLSLTENSYSENGFLWTSIPSGIAGNGNTVWFDPSSLTPGTYTVRVKSVDLADCYDECDVNIIKVDIAQSNLMVCSGDSMASLHLTASSYSPGGYTWSSIPAGISGSGTNKTISFVPGDVAPGKYIVTAQSSDLLDCADVCEVLILKVDIAMDGNRDMTIDFDNTNDNHCLFWVNDDFDVRHWEGGSWGWQEDDKELYVFSTKDCTDNRIGHRGRDGAGNPAPSSDDYALRDLEDFTVVQIRVPGVVSNLSGITYWMKFDNVTADSPRANLFEAITNSVTGPFDYLTNSTVANLQVKETKLYEISTTEQEVDASYIRFDEPVRFLLEGKAKGNGDLVFILKKDGAEICRDKIELKLRSITEFYDIYEVGRVNPLFKKKWNAEVTASATQLQTATAYSPESDKYFLFVHGWNQAAKNKRWYAETGFKRLWRQGYKGGFGLFDWPTLHGFPWPTSWLSSSPYHHYNNSEMISWLSATALQDLMEDLNTSGQLRVLAHSMGNVVTGEGIRKYSGAQNLKCYIATQAALSGSCYSQSASPTSFSDSWPFWPSNYGPDTSGILAYWHSGDTNGVDGPYLSGNASSVDRMCNYYNSDDYALLWWERNNRRKPDDSIGYGFGYGGSLDLYDETATATNRFYRWWLNIEGLEIIPSTDLRERYQVFSFDVESRARALGQSSNSGFGYVNRDLHATPLLYDKAHSRQFRSNIVDQKAYYDNVMQDCDF